MISAYTNALYANLKYRNAHKKPPITFIISLVKTTLQLGSKDKLDDYHSLPSNKIRSK